MLTFSWLIHISKWDSCDNNHKPLSASTANALFTENTCLNIEVIGNNIQTYVAPANFVGMAMWVNANYVS